MYRDWIVKITNRLAIIAACALVYWTFTFITIQVFDLKIFRENLSETFALSVLGILSVMAGALIINMMMNLTKISEALASRGGDSAPIIEAKSVGIKGLVLLMASFPLIFGGLFLGDYLTAQKKKNMLILSAKKMVAEQSSSMKAMSAYEFNWDYIQQTANMLDVLHKSDPSFRRLSLILPEKVNEAEVFISIYAKAGGFSRDQPPQKGEYVFASSEEDRSYLRGVFVEGKRDYKFMADRGNYALYYPVEIDGKVIVLYYSDFQQYGKFGS